MLFLRNPVLSEQAKRFLDAAEGDRLGALFIIALSLGLRKSEVIGLKPEDVDLDSRVIHVRRSLAWVKLPGDGEGRWIEREPKRGSFRDLPIYKVGDRVKTPRIRFHDARHSCGTLLHLQGAAPFIIQKVLGHSQLSTTKRYTHVPIQVTKTALEGMEAMFKAAAKTAEPEPVTVETARPPS